MQNNIIWNADLYSRISKDDRDADESNSIKNQRELLRNFVNDNPDITIVSELADDGYTGANFDRQAFKEMIRHIEEGKVNCVIVKDFSRLGRNHIETGKYIERYFLEKKVRFIAINENYDSIRSDARDSNNSLIVPFKNIINEAFLEDISIKTKTQLEIKRKQGEFLSNFAIYGYLKTDKKELVIDDYASSVVKRIFELKINGCNEQKIAEILNGEGILSPAEYKKSIGITYNTPFAGVKKCRWSVNAIKRILKNRAYIGRLEQGKRKKLSYRMKGCCTLPENEWVITENHHEPIIGLAEFNLVQELMRRDTRIPISEERLYLFSGMLLCGGCGQPMIVRTVKKNSKSYVYYICSTHKKCKSCTNNNISEKVIEKFALVSLQNQITSIFTTNFLEDDFGRDTLIGRKQQSIERMISTYKQSIEETKSYLVGAYEHFVNQFVTDKEYQIIKEKYKKRIEDTEENISQLQTELRNLKSNSDIKKIIQDFKDNGNLTELSRSVVVTFIDHIIVHNKNNLEIEFRYSSQFNLPRIFNLQSNTERAVM